MMLEQLTEQITNLLRNDFQFFFKHAIEHLLQDDTDYNRTMYVFSIQQALELLIKLYLLNQHGVISILDSKQIKYKIGTILSEEELLKLLHSRNLKTKNYHELLKAIKKDTEFTNREKKQLNNFQKLRNQIVHMGIDTFSPSIASDVNLLVASIFNKLEFKENSKQSNDMENTLQNLLGKNLFEDYLSKTTIIKDTEKFIMENFAPSEICFCLECNHKTVVYKWDEFRCYLCGYKMHDDYVGIMNCPNCFRKAFYFDKLNTEENNDTNGNCAACDSSFSVSKCGKCADFFIPCVTECSCNINKNNIAKKTIRKNIKLL